MSLRARLALILALLAAVAAIGVGLLSYDAASDGMLDQIDKTLTGRFPRVPDNPSGNPSDNPDDIRIPGNPGGNPNTGGDNPTANGLALEYAQPCDRRFAFGLDQNVVQCLDADGEITGSPVVTLAVTARDRAVVGKAGEFSAPHTVAGSDGHDYRVVTHGLGTGAILVGRDLVEMDSVLSDLRTRIVYVGGLAVLLAAGSGWLLAKRLTRSLRALTVAAGEVSSTGRLDIDVSETGRDEVGRLGRAFASMLAALRRSQDEQHRLVQDAGHELRTPLTSLRTNVDVLRRHSDLPAEMRAKVLDDLDIEVGELSSLVEEVVAVGSGRSSDEPTREVSLAEAVRAAADRVGRRSGRVITVVADTAVVRAQRASLERAVTNLLDNAAKFDRSDGPIEITSSGGRVAVRDHGSGIDPGDLARVFDRFFRAVAARSQPGSGLGLSIVTEVAAAHGGTTFADNHPDGGAVVGFQLPIVRP